MTKLPDPNFILLYVKNIPASATFYAELLGRPPVDSSQNFAMFALSSGVMLGLWALHDVKPVAVATGGGGEVCITVASVEEVETVHSQWRGRGLTIIQPPTKMDFGFTFVGCDPDGHRLRVFVPAAS